MGTITALDGAKIANSVYTFADTAGYTIFKDTKTNQQVIYNDPAIGLQLALYQSATGEYVIAVRGTEPFAVDGDMTTNIKMFQYIG